MGLLSSFLGNDFEIDYIKKSLFINQKRYIKKILQTYKIAERFKYLTYTPFSTRTRLVKYKGTTSQKEIIDYS